MQRSAALAHSLPNSTARAVPFVKWAGGKTQLLNKLLSHTPSSFRAYHEPFLGGGAFFFALYSTRQLSAAYLSDLNRSLIDTYIAIRDELDAVVFHLRDLEHRYYSAPSQEAFYYQIRGQEPRLKAKKAARFIFLNKTCYNGLYRVNTKGKFNVPFGRYTNPTICDEPNLRLVSRAIQDVELAVVDFRTALERAQRDDFIYLDPPYHPLTKTANFTGYTQDGFDLAAQERLADEFDRLHRIGAKVMLSNADHAVIRKLYAGKGYRIIEVKANRIINSDPSRRGPINEILVMNFDLGGGSLPNI